MLLVGKWSTDGKSNQCVTGHDLGQLLLIWQILAGNLMKAWILVAVQVGEMNNCVSDFPISYTLPVVIAAIIWAMCIPERFLI